DADQRHGVVSLLLRLGEHDGGGGILPRRARRLAWDGQPL
ncbi:MAG: hypothetical protein AVDCRST_MAG58-2498, partial [uncultured Rubrobacteraceae bacterium]